MRPDKNPHNRRPGAAPSTPPSMPPPAPPKPDAGPRPLSPRQQAHLQGTPRGHLPQMTTPPPGPVAKSRPVPPRTNEVGRRPEPSHVRRRPIPKKTVRARALRSARNRRRVNIPRLLLGWAAFALVAECVVAALWSPRFWVRELIVEGNATVATETLTQRLALREQSNLLRLSASRLVEVAGAEPAVEVAEIRRSLPGTVHLLVRERTPWAAVQVGRGGAWYVMDRHLIPFRSGKKPERGLPLLALETPAGGGTSKPVTLGKAISAPGLAEVSQCLAWSSARPDFPLERIAIDGDGKLCLNRMGGVRVTLGSGIDLERKLETLGLLLARRADLQGAGETQIASVNLIAYDAPALALRKAAPPGAKGELAPLSTAGARRRQAPQ